MQKLMQIKDYLLEIAFLFLLGRIIMVGASMGEAIAVVSLVLSMAYNKWLNKTADTRYESLYKDIEDMKSKINSLSLDKGLQKRTIVHEEKSEQSFKRYF